MPKKAPPHPLLDYLRRRQMSCAEFSRVSGVDPTTISLALNGRRPFSVAAAVRIEAATAGKVSARRLVPSIPRRRRVA